MRDLEFMVRASARALEYRAVQPIDEWAAENIRLPSNTSEPGLYNPSRAPYQRQILRDLSPTSPVRQITLVWGSQNGKTTVENLGMAFYMKENPAPIGFGFSDEGNLRNYVKHKFDPLLEANPEIKGVLRAAGGKGTGDSLDGKTFPGGFIKFFSGKSAAALRSDSFMVVFGDELDEWGMTKDGDPVKLLQKRTNTFGDRAKICLSSTPKNASPITEILKGTTFNKYHLKCPCCGSMFTLEMDNFHWSADGGHVTEAWFECPECSNIIRNEDKLTLLSPEHGARWIPTNTKADPTSQGYYLPTFYAPVGWIDWREIAQEYYEACLTESGVDHEKMTTFYNTILGLPYIVGSESSDGRVAYEKSLTSPYRRGRIPSWVSFITTGGDVQGNRIEVTVMGWGFRGRHIAIDHLVLMNGPDDDIEMIDCTAWREYRDQVLEATWEREDGLVMRSLANGLDRSFKPDTVAAFWLSLDLETRERMFPVRGYDAMSGLVPSRKFVKKEGLSGSCFWDVPVSNIKRQVYTHLRLNDNSDGTVAFMPHYPADYDQEFYMQLFSEFETVERGKPVWKKSRDRNEVLDTHVYNYGMFYLMGLGQLTDEDWEGIAASQDMQMERHEEVRRGDRRSRRQRSGGIVI